MELQGICSVTKPLPDLGGGGGMTQTRKRSSAVGDCGKLKGDPKPEAKGTVLLPGLPLPHKNPGVASREPTSQEKQEIQGFGKTD